MELLYPGYKSYFDRFRTKPFHTEYTTRYCNSEAPVLYSQVPKYTWYEPRRPSVAARDEGTTKLTHLRPPFAARMTSYEPEGTYHVGKTACREATLSGRSGPFQRKGRSSVKLPEVFSTSTERGLSREGSVENHELQMERMCLTENTRGARTSARHKQLKECQCSQSSGLRLRQANISESTEPSTSLSKIASSFSAARAQSLCWSDPRILTRDRRSEEVTSNPPSNSGDEWILGRVAPRPSSLLSKHPKDIRYVRDTCFFQPTQERKRHYYIVNPSWFSEQRVAVPKNNVFS